MQNKGMLGDVVHWGSLLQTSSHKEYVIEESDLVRGVRKVSKEVPLI